MIDYCLANGIEPVVTYHHFSSPAWLITKGGWESPDVVRYFERYAKYVTEHVAGKVKYVCTINDANMRLQMAFLIKDITERMSKQSEIQNQEGSVQVGVNLSQNQSQMMMSMMETAKAFNIDDPRKVANFISQASEEGDLLVMKAHNAARNAIKSVDPSIQVGLTLSLHDIQCVDGGEENAKKAWDDEFTHYLPYIEKDDFLGVQCYTRKIFDENGANSSFETGTKTQMGYEDYPAGIVNDVRRCAEEFKGTIIVTENGIATSDDERRCEFIKEALTGLNDCINEGIKLKGYFAWSLLDNFEWQKGFSMTFGLIAVDRNTMERTPKKSLKVLGSFMEK